LLRRFAPRNDDLGLYAVLRLPRFARNGDLALSEDRSSRSLRSLRMTLFVMFGNATLRSRVGARDDCFTLVETDSHAPAGLRMTCVRGAKWGLALSFASFSLGRQRKWWRVEGATPLIDNKVPIKSF